MWQERQKAVLSERVLHAGCEAKQRQKEKHAERKNLSRAAYGRRRTHHDHAREYGAKHHENNDGDGRHYIRRFGRFTS
jgi:hypothetical protein